MTMIIEQSSNLLEHSVGMVNSVISNHSKLATDLLLFSLGGSKHINEPINKMKDKLKELTSSLNILQEKLNTFMKKKGDRMVTKHILPVPSQTNNTSETPELHGVLIPKPAPTPTVMWNSTPEVVGKPTTITVEAIQPK
jgi:hypothetical protein